jgi:hypothetical protein
VDLVSPPLLTENGVIDGGHATTLPTRPSELQPAFLVTVTLDGDDYPPNARESVEDFLRGALEALKDTRLIRAFELEVRT